MSTRWQHAISKISRLNQYLGIYFFYFFFQDAPLNLIKTHNLGNSGNALQAHQLLPVPRGASGWEDSILTWCQHFPAHFWDGRENERLNGATVPPQGLRGMSLGLPLGTCLDITATRTIWTAVGRKGLTHQKCHQGLPLRGLCHHLVTWVASRHGGTSLLAVAGLE